MEVSYSHGIVLDPAEFPDVDDEDRALDAARALLIARGHRARAVDRALLLTARAEMVWWSDRLGFTHDCGQHDAAEASAATCDPGARRVPMVLGLPDELTRPAGPVPDAPADRPRPTGRPS